MSQSKAILLTIVLCAAGAALGWFLSPLLARTHYTVQQADQVRFEQSRPGSTPTLQSTAFRERHEEPEALYTRAAAVERSFAVASPILGAWCGLAFALTILSIARNRESAIYEIDYDICLSCGRCFTYCPREQVRLRQLARAKTPTPTTGGPQ